MKPIQYFFLLIVIQLFVCSAGWCFSVTATVDKTRITMEDSIYLQVEVKGGKAELDMSVITDFKVMSRGTASSYNYINGRSEHKINYNYILLPLKKGDLVIPRIPAQRDGKIRLTKKINITVLSKGHQETKALFAVSEVSDDQIYVGQQTIFTLRFFTSRRISELGFENPPRFENFSFSPFDKEKSYNQTINGLPYRVTEVKYMIQPVEAGKKTIAPSVLVANVVFKSKKNPVFDSFFSGSFFSETHTKPVRISSNPVDIEVMPLPKYQENGNFSGLIGKFAIQSEVDKMVLRIGESATWTITITGYGNIIDAGLPEIHLNSDAFKIYDDTPSDNIHLTQNGFEGARVFKKAIVPVHPGMFEIKPVTLIYFNVEKDAYDKISTEKFRLEVIPSGEMIQVKTDKKTSPLNPVSKKEVTIVNKDILEIKEGLEVLKNYKEMSLIIFCLYLISPGIVFFLLSFYVRMSGKKVSNGSVMKERAKDHFKSASKMDVKDDRFLGHLYAGVMATVLAKADKIGESLTKEEVRDILENVKLEGQKIHSIETLIETIEDVRFGGRKIDETKARDIMKSARQIAKMLCVLLVCLTLFAISPGNTLSNHAQSFANGVNLYKNGDFIKSAETFENIVKNDVNNPYLFYNIGNAYLKANQVGHAILWYERAKRLAPDDPDLNFNLSYANSLIKDKSEETQDIRTILFFWERRLPVKYIKLSAIACSALFFAWASVRVYNRKQVFSGAGIICFTLFCFFSFASGFNFYHRNMERQAVVIQEKVFVKSGVTDAATVLFSLHEGSKISIKERRKGQLKIIFSKEKMGWIDAGAAKTI